MPRAKKITPTKTKSLRGMNNLPQSVDKFVDEYGVGTPQLILNAFVTDGGKVKARGGYTRFQQLNNCHSIWAGSVKFCVADGVVYPTSLWSITEQGVVELCGVDGPRARMNYVELDGLVYLSSPYWNAIYDIGKSSFSGWGLALPPAPHIFVGGGDLAPGRYLLCYTRYSGGRISGSGPLGEVILGGESGGISLTNIPVDGVVWVTQPDGSDLFLAKMNGTSIQGQYPDFDPLMSLGMAPPPKFVHMTYAHGRIWGVRGPNLYFSEPNQYEWFHEGGFKPFPEDLVMVAPVVKGLFVSSRESTWFLRGDDPKAMEVDLVGNGAVPGTMAIGLVEGGGYEISKRQSQLPSPIWIDQRGFCVGTQTGHLVHLTEHRLHLVPRSWGASVFRSKDGIPRVLTSMWGPALSEENEAIKQVMSIGRLYVPKPVEQEGEGGISISN